MIPREEVLDVARSRALNPNVVEKDYVLGWFLMEIAQHPLTAQWVFKGGTCLKKCFFETYRFSEDLDFTVPLATTYDLISYRKALRECARVVTEKTGIQFPESNDDIKESQDKAGRTTFQAKVSYRGPLMPQISTPPRIKFDLTRHERIVEQPQRKPVRHFYSDAPDPPVRILCYTVEEVLAEKTRALFERKGRARDLYDVVNISRNYHDKIDARKALFILQEKFNFKGISIPSLDEFLSAIDLDVLEANWDQQLQHQLPFLPPVQSYIEELRGRALWWMIGEPRVSEAPVPSGGPGERSIPPMAFPQMGPRVSPSYGLPPAAGEGSLDRARYAARNRLCAEIAYHGVTRLVEPYSLRIRSTGNLLLYVHEILREGVSSNTTKAYKVAELGEVRITNRPFQPRYLVEL